MDDRCNPGKGGVHWFVLCGWCFFASRNAGSPCSRTDSYEASDFGLQINWSKTKVSSSTSSSTVQVADGHVEVVEAFAYVGCIIDSSGGSTGEVLRQIGMNMLERRIWKSSVRLETKLRLYLSTRHTLCQFWCMGERHGPPVHHKVPCALVLMRYLTRGHYTQNLEDTVYSPSVKCGSQRNHWLFTAALYLAVTNWRLRLFGHTARRSSREDHHRARAAATR